MAGGMYSAGKVGVDIVPDTSGFWALLHAELSSRRPEVTVDVNMRGVAQAESTLSRLDGRTLTNVVRIEGDDSGLRRIDRMIRQQRLLWEKRPITSKYDLDDRPFISKITRLASTVENGTERVSSFVKQSERSVTDTLRDNITSLRKTQSEYDREVAEATRRRERLINDEKAAYDMYAEGIDANRVRIERLTTSLEDANRTLEWSKRRMKELRAEGDTAGADWFKNTRIPELREQIKGFTAQIREAKKEIRDYKKEQDKLYTADFDNRVAEQTRKIEDGTRKWEESVDAIREYSSRLKDSKLLQDEFAQSTDRMTSMFRKSLDVQKQADILARRQAQTLPRLTEGQRMLADVLGEVDGRYTDLDGAVSDSMRAMDRQRLTARDLTDVFDEQGNAVRDLMQAFERFKPMGIDRLTGKQLNQTIKQLDALKEYAVRHPIEAKLRMDTGDLDRSYTDVMFKAEKLRAKLERDHEVDVRVKVWEDSADRLEQRLERLRHTRVDIPVDWQVEQEGLITAMRETAAKIKADPSRRWELEADLDVSMHRAEEKLKKFEDEHDELKMDLDLETALARAHLAYFTRPRTVDIFANFKGTDLGKILTGMTSGATGLKGVQNQFDNLVNTFDKLDKVVPKWSLLGAGLTSLGAGLLNLGRTVGGVGVSLVSMSKAALAAPAALAGLASAGYVGYRVFGDLKERFDVTRTALADLNHQLGDSAWDEYGDDLYRLADDIAPTLARGLNGIAVEEGKVLDGLISVVRQSDETRQLPNIFDNTRTAVANLNPGLQSLARAFLSLGDSTSLYLPRMTSYLSDVAAKWADWVDTARQSGAIDTAMRKAIEQGGYLKSSVMDLMGILKGTLGTLAESENGLQGFSEAIGKANRAVQSMRFQETLKAWADGAQAAQDGMRNSFKDVGDALYSLKDITRSVFSDAGQIIGSGITAISRVLQQSKNGIRDFSSGIRDGFTEAFDAIGDAGPMFDSFLSMTGALSRSFGGTFAATLRSAAPIIKAIATAAEAAANAFNALPDPIKSAMGLWVTFGRSTVTAFNSLKTGMLQNIQQTLQYRSTLQQLGLTADTVRPKFTQLAAAMAALNRSEVGGVLSGNVSSLTMLGTQAESTARKVKGAGEAVRQSGESFIYLADGSKKAVNQVEKVPTTLNRIGGAAKTAGSALLGLVGGWQGLALTATIGTAATAWSSYQEHVAKAQASQEAFNNAATATPGALTEQAKSLDELSDRLDNFATTTKKTLSDDEFDVWDNLGKYGYAKTFDDVNDALSTFNKKAGTTKLSMDDIAKAASGSKADFDKLHGTLQKINKEGTSQSFGWYASTSTDAASAANDLDQQLVKTNEQMLQSLELKARDAGVTEGWVRKMWNAGEDIQSISDGLLTQTQRSEALAAVQSSLTGIIDQQHSANLKLITSASGYQSTLQQVGSAIQQVNALQQQGQRVWDDAANSFDYTTEAGRTAANALTSLASSSNDYLTAMIESGKSADEVKKTQQELSDNFNTAAQNAGVAGDAIDGLNQSLLMTPRDVDIKVAAHTLEARSSLSSMVDQMAFLFPDHGRTATKELLLKSVWAGKTDADQLMDMVQKLADGTHEVAFTTNGEAVMVPIGELEDKCIQLADGTYRIRLDSEGDASEKVQEVENKVAQLNGVKADVQVLLDAKDNASSKIQNAVALAKAFGLSDEEITLIANTDNASDKLDDIKAKLRDKGLTDAQINVLLDAIDKASPKMDDVDEKKNRMKNNPASFKIDANDDDAKVKLATYVEKDGQTIATNNVAINGTDNVSPQAQIAQAAVLAIPQFWNSTFNGTDNVSGPASVAQMAVTGIPQLWSSLFTGTDNTSSPANDARNAVSSIPQSWVSTLTGTGNTSPFAAMAEAAVRAIPQMWQSQMNGSGTTPTFANSATTAVRNVPESKTTTLSAVGNALDYASSLLGTLQSIASGAWTAVVNTVTGGGHAYGGRIHGPGTATSDSIPAWLSNGEMVIRASSVRKIDAAYGREFLNTLNAYGKTPQNSDPSPVALKYRARSYAYAAGGRVTAMRTPTIQVTPTVTVENQSDAIDQKQLQATIEASVSAALKQAQMKLAFDARGIARVLAEPMSREMGMLEKSGRMR